MKHALYIALYALSSVASASTDFACLNRCQAAGSGYQWCQSRCEYEPMPTLPTFGHQPDQACVRQCQAAGSYYAYCQQVCQ